MTCNVIQGQLTDYVKDELTRDEAETVANHIQNCPPCQSAEAEIRKSFGLLRFLPTAKPSANVWSRISAELDSSSHHPVTPIRDSRFPQFAAIAAAALVLVTLTAVALFKHPQPDPASNHAVARIERLGDGVAIYRTLNGERLKLVEGATIAQDETVTMDPGAAAIFSIAGVGRFRVSGGSTLRLTGDRSIELERGEVIADITPGGRGFTVHTRDARATVLGTLFRVHAGEDRTALLVARGTVNFGNERGSVAVGAGSQSFSSGGAAPSAPLALDTNAAEWDLFRSVAPGPTVTLAVGTNAAPGRIPFTVTLTSDQPTTCETRLSERTYLMLTLTDPAGTVHVERLAAAELELSASEPVSDGRAHLDGGRSLTFRGTLPAAAAPGTYTATATYASAGSDLSWGGWAESRPVRFEVKR